MISKSSSFDNKPRFKPQKQKWPQQEVVKLQILCRDVMLDMCVKFPSNPKTQSCEKQQYLPNGSFSKIAVTDHNNKKTCLLQKAFHCNKSSHIDRICSCFHPRYQISLALRCSLISATALVILKRGICFWIPLCQIAPAKRLGCWFKERTELTHVQLWDSCSIIDSACGLRDHINWCSLIKSRRCHFTVGAI